MKKILVTGGAGFLGSHLIRRLLNQGHEVVCVDNFYTGKRENIAELRLNPNFSFTMHDITHSFNPPPFKMNLEFDEIYNLACPASPVHYQYDPIKTILTNVLGSMNVLKLAEQHNSKIFQASTSEVYGNPLIHPQTEDYWGNTNPIGIRSCYDEGKRCAETLFFDYQRKRGLDIKVARIFNTYGPRMDVNDGRVVSNFINQALRNIDITVYGDGSQTRSFCYVDDLIDGFIALMDSKLHGPVNLGNSTEFTVLQLANIVIQLTNSNSKIIFNDLPSDDPMMRKPDITLAKRELGFNPQIELIAGLKKTIEYFDNTLRK
jgi:UDP-glucuronate decarboxylase